MSKVQLAIYDLSRGMAMSLSQSILGQRIDGIWHTGVIVFSLEYYFGGGIQASPTGHFPNTNQLPAIQIIDIGITNKSQLELTQYLQSINHLFRQETYDLITNNCNNFSDTVCKFLCNVGIPDHIINLPRIVFSTPGGMMLRPMIENMQNNIRRQSNIGGMDPFATTTSSFNSTNTLTYNNNNNNNNTSSLNINSSMNFETNLSNSVREVAMNMLQNNNNSKPIIAMIEEKSLISNDSSSIQNLIKKIINYKYDEHNILSTIDIDVLQVISTTILSYSKAISTSNNTTNQQQSIQADDMKGFSIEAYQLIKKLLETSPNLHMSCLFILRLMFLYDTTCDYHKVDLIPMIMNRLLNRNDQSFSTISASVLGICTISNLLSHQHGANYLLSNNNSNFINDIIDICLTYMSHDRIEIRQISVALAYNYILLNTKNNQLSHLWIYNNIKQISNSTGNDTTITYIEESNDNYKIELNQHAIQLLCNILENLYDEIDIIVRIRKLSIICRIIRVYKKLAIDFLNELGFDEILTRLFNNKYIINPKLTELETNILLEIKQI